MISPNVISVEFDEGIRETIARYPAYTEYPGMKAAIAFPWLLAELITQEPTLKEVPGCTEFEGWLLRGALIVAESMKCRLLEDDVCDDVLQLIFTLSYPQGSCDWRFFFHLQKSQPIPPPHR